MTNDVPKLPNPKPDIKANCIFAAKDAQVLRSINQNMALTVGFPSIGTAPTLPCPGSCCSQSLLPQRIEREAKRQKGNRIPNLELSSSCKGKAILKWLSPKKECKLHSLRVFKRRWFLQPIFKAKKILFTGETGSCCCQPWKCFIFVCWNASHVDFAGACVPTGT